MSHLRRLLRHLLPPSSQSLQRQITPPILFSVRSFSSPSSSDIARSISAELTKLSSFSAPSADLPAHLSLHFSDVRLSPPLLKEVLDLSPAAGRAALSLFRWAVRDRGLAPSDASLAHLVDYLGRRHDFKAARELLSEFRVAAGPLSLSAALLRLARAGRPSDALHFFANMTQDFNFPRDRRSLHSLVDALTAHGAPSHAERAVKAWAHEIFPDIEICSLLIKGWCDELKLEEARRLMGEIQRGGFELGTPAFNSVLDCVCRLCRQKYPLRLEAEASKVLDEMQQNGIPRDPDTFHVLIYNLCKIRKTEDAMKVFREMGEWGCSPVAETYLALIRSLYQAARLLEGDEMIGFMRAAQFGAQLDRKAYYGFIKILCGIERVEHAMKVFRMMKGYGHSPGVKSYTLLIGKLAVHNQVDRANALFKEAVARGVPVEHKVYKVDPRYVKVKKEKVKKRLTLPEKMVMKRRRLKKLRLSFVKKPNRSMRRVI